MSKNFGARLDALEAQQRVTSAEVKGVIDVMTMTEKINRNFFFYFCLPVIGAVGLYSVYDYWKNKAKRLEDEKRWEENKKRWEEDQKRWKEDQKRREDDQKRRTEDLRRMLEGCNEDEENNTQEQNDVTGKISMTT